MLTHIEDRQRARLAAGAGLVVIRKLELDVLKQTKKVYFAEI